MSADFLKPIVYKRFTVVAASGFVLLLALGLGTNLFLHQNLQQRVDAAAAETLLLNRTRVLIREAQVAFMEAANQLTDLLLDPADKDTFNEKKRQEEKLHEHAIVNLDAAIAGTTNKELNAMLRQLVENDRQVILPIKDQVLYLATRNPRAAQKTYWQKYLPAQAKNMAIIKEAVILSSREVSDFSKQADEATAQAQTISRLTIVLFGCLGLGVAAYIGQGLARSIIQTGKAARENRDMMDNSLDVICSIDESGCFVHVSRACEATWGYTADELAGRSYLELVHPDDVDRSRHFAAEVMSGHSTRDFGNRYIHKDGSVVHLLWSARWAKDRRQIFCVAHDVSEAKRANEALRASEERTRQIVATAHDAFVGMDGTGNIIDWNRQAQATFGWSFEEARGQSFEELIVAPSSRALYLDTVYRLGTGGDIPTTIRRIELTARNRGGHELPIEFSVSLISGGETHEFGAFLRDITEQKQRERELHRAKEAAEAATTAKSSFLANMSHEIRTPMNGVIGLTDLMLKTPLSSQQLEFMTLIKSSADSLLRLLNDILDFSKMEANKLELDDIEFDLRELVGNTLKAFSAAANEKGIELAYRVAPEVPLLLQGDPGRLAQIIVNLTGNALKFTKQGEVVLRVMQESLEEAAIKHVLLRFNITDTGIGMTAEQQVYIFDAFAQGDSSTTRKYGGTGLGLTIVSQLVKLMRGSVGVESELGKGTTFYFTAKFAVPDRQPEILLRQDLKNVPVLIVEDNSTNRLILEEILSSWSMQPVLATNSTEALAELLNAAALGKPYPLVLLDSRMPECDGFQLIELISHIQVLAGTTIMMLSSNDAYNEIKRYKEIGIASYLRKPVKPSELFNAIMVAMSRTDDGVHIVSSGYASRPQPSRALNVLIAEDNLINQKVVEEILRNRGHSFATAGDGIEAVRMLDEQQFDVILMDGQMPRMDGYQATVEIRKREKNAGGKHVRIIALTAAAMKDDRERCLAAGMDDYIPKPIDPALLLRLLESEETSGIQPGGADSSEETSLAIQGFNPEAALKRVNGKQPLLIRLVHVFLQEIPLTLADIREAAGTGDLNLVAHSAHRLKGAASTISAQPVADAAAKLEQIAKTGEIDGVYACFDELRALAEGLTAELEAFINGDSIESTDRG